MAEAVEIYLCQPGQKLKEGRLVKANNIPDKNAAKVDAGRRCKSDRNLVRIAYYRVNDAGDFKMLYSHKNKNANPAPGGSRKKNPKRKRSGKSL